MNTTFRCEYCGRPMPLAFQEGTTQARCPHCGKLIKIPASLAALPHPHVDADAIEGRPVEDAELVGAAVPAGECERGEQILAAAMPWLLSALLHLGLAVIMLFIAMVSVPAPADPPLRPRAVARLQPVRKLKPPKAPSPKLPDLPSSDAMKKYRQKMNESKAPIRDDTGKDKKVELTPDRPGAEIEIVIGREGGDGIFDRIGDGDGDDDDGDDGDDDDGEGGGLRADHIVFVIDRSGSMVGKFDSVRMAMCLRVSYLDPDQEFHAVLFADNNVQENTPHRLVRPTPENKITLVEFLEGIRPSGQTGPLPALRRAFAVLKNARKADGTEGVKLMYLLTDGEFRENDKVVEAIRQMNAKGRGQVYINTILYGARPPKAVKVMKVIAEENKGRYIYASPDE